MLIAPNAATYATRVPYITPGEFKAHPTGVESAKLVVNGSTAANDQALLQVIRRASSLADGMCGDKILAATVDTQSGSYRVQRDGKIKIPLDLSPVVAVDTVKAGLAPGSQIALEQGPDWFLNGRILSIPTSFGGLGGGVPDRLFATVRYVNGWVNVVLTQPVDVGATSLLVNNALGIVPGMTLSLSGATSSEFVVVDPSYVPSTAMTVTEVPLLDPISFHYGVGDVASSFPPDVKLAVILLTAGIIKARGTKALVMGNTRSSPETETRSEEVNEQEMQMASEILSSYRRTI
jgi:hypothetical protein